jgi:hypothetical protein
MGEELVRSQGLTDGMRHAVWGLILIVSCEQPLRPNKRIASPGGPQIAATVVTIRTTVQPSNRTTMTSIVIGEDFARATEEVGTWRLFDFKQDRVAFVDEFAKTFRYESLQSLVRRHAAATDEPISDKLPRAQHELTGLQRPIMGLTATQAVVKLGAYRREIWFAEHPLIPAQLFALMQASETPGPDAPMAKKVDDELLRVRAFPLLDHAELPYAQSRIVIDRIVVSVDRRNVAESLLQIPTTFKEVKSPPSPTAPASHPPASSSPPHDQKTPEGGSRSSATGQKTP